MFKCKKIIGSCLLAVMLVCINMPISAATPVDPYQAVIDKLNKEYSMDIHFMSESETQTYSSSSQRDIDITPEEFEANLREQIIENNRAKAEADKKIAELKTKDIVESGSGVCTPVESQETRSSSTVTRSKKIAGATAYLTAKVSNTPGYWMHSAINSVYTTYVAGTNSKPPFTANTYNYDLIDSRRTCAVRLYGNTLGDYGTIIDSNAYRYVEFWAGSGM